MNLQQQEGLTIDLLEGNPANQAKDLFYYIVQMGVGGNGSEITRQVSQFLSTSGVPHIYILVDPDEISEKNIRNQIFLKEEVGLKKADVLAERYGSAYENLNILSFSDKFIESVKDVANLFKPEYLDLTNYSRSRMILKPLMIGTVDNAFTRSVLGATFKTFNECIYIDAGNESVTLPHDKLTRDMSEWTEEELAAYKNSGWTGQVVCGYKSNKYYQPCVTEVLTNILEEANELRPSEMSCQELASSDPQRTIVNRYAALAVLSYLSEIIEEKQITSHITHFHAKAKYMRTEKYIVPLEENTDI